MKDVNYAPNLKHYSYSNDQYLEVSQPFASRGFVVHLPGLQDPFPWDLNSYTTETKLARTAWSCENQLSWIGVFWIKSFPRKPFCLKLASNELAALNHINH